MSDIKFSCPSCQQHIQCEDNYGGMQINCPSCAAPMVVPQLPPPPTPSTAPPPVPSPGAVSRSAASAPTGCPECGAALGRGAVLCTSCGYNLATRQKLSPGAAAARRGATIKTKESWLASPLLWGGLVTVVLGGLFLLAKTNPEMVVVYAGVQALFALSMHITVVVFAFREGAGAGMLTLCLWPYTIYFVFTQLENQLVKLLYMLAVLSSLAMYMLK
jgi:hypothetical protein